MGAFAPMSQNASSCMLVQLCYLRSSLRHICKLGEDLKHIKLVNMHSAQQASITNELKWNVIVPSPCLFLAKKDKWVG
jgi:hypothetical protein